MPDYMVAIIAGLALAALEIVFGFGSAALWVIISP